MNVKEIVDLVAGLSIGLEQPTPDDQDIFLKYVNLVHFELYSKTVANNPFIQTVTETVNVVDGVAANTAVAPFIFRHVYLPSGRALRKTSAEDILKRDPTLKTVGFSSLWYFFNGRINIYPKSTQAIGVLYVPSPRQFTLTTLEAEIPYPPISHQILVDGAAYYLYQSEAGFKAEGKLYETKMRYESGKTQLLSYLQTIGGNPHLSTYRDV